MSKFETKLKEELKKLELSDSSIKTYLSNLKILNNHNKLLNLKFLDDKNKIDDLLMKYKPQTRKNYYIAIYKSLEPFKKYSKLREKYGEHLSNLNKSINENSVKKERLNWNEILEIYNKKSLSLTKRNLNYNDLLCYLIASLYTINKPLRNKEFILMKIKNYKPEENHINNGKFYISDYKAKASHGQLIIDIAPELQKIINKYLQVRKKLSLNSDYFLVDSNNKKFNNQNKITECLNKFFGDGISSTYLRHSYLTSKYGDINEEKKKDMKEMGHGRDAQNYYIET